MFVYTQAARECCSEPRSLHRILLAKLMMCCAGWGREGGGALAILRPSDPGASCLPAGKVRMRP